MSLCILWMRSSSGSVMSMNSHSVLLTSAKENHSKYMKMHEQQAEGKLKKENNLPCALRERTW